MLREHPREMDASALTAGEFGHPPVSDFTEALRLERIVNDSGIVSRCRRTAPGKATPANHLMNEKGEGDRGFLREQRAMAGQARGTQPRRIGAVHEYLTVSRVQICRHETKEG